MESDVLGGRWSRLGEELTHVFDSRAAHPFSVEEGEDEVGWS